MKELLNRPRVFLSHSKRDKEFINVIYQDLQRCQIAPWIDEIDIRHGQDWLDAIFEGSIPTCDCIIIYLTENSITSQMVKKEIDTSIIQKLKNNKISLLPYVSEASIRNKLRADMQTLQIPEWNDNNYHELLPCVVAEIWHSYMERNIEIAINEERSKRLELELEFEKNKKERSGVFSDSEIKDFSYIKEQLDYDEMLEATIVNKQTEKAIKTYQIEVNILSLIPFITDPDYYSYTPRKISRCIINLLKNSKIYQDINAEDKYIHINIEIDISNKLLVYGLVAREERTEDIPTLPSKFFRPYPEVNLAYTPKLDRFKYWLAYNNILPNNIKWSVRKEVE